MDAIKYISATQFALAAAEWFKWFAESEALRRAPTNMTHASANLQSGNGSVNNQTSDNTSPPSSLRSDAENVVANQAPYRFRSATQGTSGNPGQLLAFGYHGQLEQVADFFNKVATIEVSDEYKQAYNRWFEYCRENGFALAKARLRNRAFLGMGCTDVFETHVQLHSVFGVPFISGETLKGLTSAYAACLLDERNLSEEQVKWLFGTRSESGTPGTAGNLQFHDAWWIPEDNSRPLTLEIDTPHHREYYQKECGTPATDYDDPNPVTHLAVKGSFLLAISGDVFAASLAVKIAAKALATLGVGGRKSAGYGLASVTDPP